ncbi:formylglycine-generating enzyme family protein [Bacteroidota bacterium]
MIFKKLLFTGILLLSTHLTFSQWLDISNITLSNIQTEHGGPVIEISYDLTESDLTDSVPAYVFVHYTLDEGNTWQLVDPVYMKGNGFGVVSSQGNKKIILWAVNEKGIKDPEVKVRGIRMARIPAGDFKMKSFPAGGKDPSKTERPNTVLPVYYMAVNETTIGMYIDYLNDGGRNGSGWHDRMANERRCGIIRKDSLGRMIHRVVPGRENYPITYVSWYDAISFLKWCGLTLPTEAMWEKAYVGGYYLDGDESKQVENPLPDRKYPWGNEVPYEGNVFRCNFDRDRDGYEFLSPVGTYSDFASPYTVNDLAGNAAEWTYDWYSTEYHAGLDGFRMVRGGSWLAMPFAVDAISGATQFPIKESSIMGFRGALAVD